MFPQTSLELLEAKGSRNRCAKPMKIWRNHFSTVGLDHMVSLLPCSTEMTVVPEMVVWFSHAIWWWIRGNATGQRTPGTYDM